MSKNVNLVSVVIPIYNVEKYLDEAIQSILNQSYKYLQIILVNDGSTDSSFEIAKKYEKSDNRVELVSQENRGLSGARNSGLKLAKGKYIYFFDSDDYLKERAIEDCVIILERDEADIVRFSASIHPDSAKNFKFINNTYEVPTQLNNNTLSVDEYISSSKKFTSSVPLYLFNNSFIQKNKLFFYEGILHEDELWTTRVLMYAKSISFLSDDFFLRRYRENSIMVSKNNNKKKGRDLLIISKQLTKERNISKSKLKNKLLEKRIIRNTSVALTILKLGYKENTKIMKSLRVSKLKVFIFIMGKKTYQFVRSI